MLPANSGYNYSMLAPACAKNWERKQVSLTAGVGKETGFVAGIMTSVATTFQGKGGARYSCSRSSPQIGRGLETSRGEVELVKLVQDFLAYLVTVFFILENIMSVNSSDENVGLYKNKQC